MIQQGQLQQQRGNMQNNGDMDMIQGNIHEQGGTNIGNIVEAEKGETKEGKVIFSDRLKITKADVKEFELPAQYLNKTIAEVSKLIENQFSLRKNDALDNKERKRRLDILISIQEEKQQEIAMKEQQNQPIDPTIQGNPMEQDIPQDMQQPSFGMQQEMLPQEMEQGMEQGMPQMKYGSSNISGEDKGQQNAAFQYRNPYSIKDELMRMQMLMENKMWLNNQRSKIVNLPKADNGYPNVRYAYNNMNAKNSSSTGQFNSVGSLLNMLNYNTDAIDNPEIELNERKFNRMLPNVIKDPITGKVESSMFKEYFGETPKSQVNIDALGNRAFGKGDIPTNNANDNLDISYNQTNALTDNMGNFYDIARGMLNLGKKEKTFDRISPEYTRAAFLSPNKAIQDANLAYGNAANDLQNNTRGLGNYLSNMLALRSSQAQNKAGINAKYDETNVGIENATRAMNSQAGMNAQQFNAGTQRYEEDIRQREKDIASNMIQAGLSNMAEMQMNRTRSLNKYKMDMAMLRAMNTTNWKYNNAGMMSYINPNTPTINGAKYVK
jgi:hypothetical protein